MIRFRKSVREQKISTLLPLSCGTVRGSGHLLIVQAEKERKLDPKKVPFVLREVDRG